MSLFSTTLGHLDRSKVVIPNRKIVGEILHNYGAIRQIARPPRERPSRRRRCFANFRAGPAFDRGHCGDDTPRASAGFPCLGGVARMSAVPGYDRSRFESCIQALEAEIANVGAHLAIDGAGRQAYAQQIKAMADELRIQASSGKITWSQAAAQAQDARNTIMEIVRSRSTPVGRAMAEQLKRQGRTLNELVARKTQQLHGPDANFSRLSPAQQNAVYAEIVKGAGRSNPRVTTALRRLSRAGRGLIVLSIGLSIYNIATAEDKTTAAGREAALTGAGIGGGIAGGALAGLACGPGAPVCVTAGAFIGGALAAFGVDLLW